MGSLSDLLAFEGQEAQAKVDLGLELYKQEWHEKQPEGFYITSQAAIYDQVQGHLRERRRVWTDTIRRSVEQFGSRVVLDFGCGAGDDLLALPESVVKVGIEVNERLREFAAWRAQQHGVNLRLFRNLDECRQYRPQVVICLDVLEHLPDALHVVDRLAQLLPVGGFLWEATTTQDIANPSHLESLWGWRPDVQLLRLGFELVYNMDWLNLWKRTALSRDSFPPMVSVPAYRAIEPRTVDGMNALARRGWIVSTRSQDALISRARNIEATNFLRRTACPVLVFIDDDIIFAPEDAEALVAACTSEYPLVGGIYVTRDGKHPAARLFTNQKVEFSDENTKPVEVAYLATGFMAIHRTVLERMAEEMPLLHPDDERLMQYPFFQPLVYDRMYLSEDWAFCQRARDLGYKSYILPSIRLGHVNKYIYTLEDVVQRKEMISNVSLTETSLFPNEKIALR